MPTIDLVVEGMEDRRLAIECDGDQYHGPGKWSADMARQRVLERAQWTFWRCFSSSFTLNREAVLDDLLTTLRKMGIEPIGATELDIGRYVEHCVVDPFAVTGAVAQILTGDGVIASSVSSSAPIRRTQIIGRPEPTRAPGNADQGRAEAAPGTLNQPAVTGSGSLGHEETAVISHSFSEEALRQFLDAHGLKSRDNRGKMGAMWVFVERDDPVLISQLRAWGFQLKPGKGWWRT